MKTTAKFRCIALASTVVVCFIIVQLVSGIPDPPPPDTDNDGLTDYEESLLGTNPNNPDTDGDGVNDWFEHVQGRNPLIAGSVADTNGTIKLDVFTPLK